MEVYGQKGYVITVGRDQVRVRLPEREETSASAKALEKTKEDSVSYLRAVLLGGLKPEGQSSLETNVIVTEILDAARQSAATGKTVPLAGKRESDGEARFYFTETLLSTASRTFSVTTCGLNDFCSKRT